MKAMLAKQRVQSIAFGRVRQNRLAARLVRRYLPAVPLGREDKIDG